MTSTPCSPRNHTHTHILSLHLIPVSPRRSLGTRFLLAHWADRLSLLDRPAYTVTVSHATPRSPVSGTLFHFWHHSAKLFVAVLYSRPAHNVGKHVLALQRRQTESSYQRQLALAAALNTHCLQASQQPHLSREALCHC